MEPSSPEPRAESSTPPGGEQPPAGPPATEERHPVVLFILTRLVIYGAYRVIYPFLGVFAAGIGISLQTASLALSGRSLTGVLGPLLAPIADRYGRKAGMLAGMGLFCIGMGLVALWPSFPTFLAGLVLGSLGNQVFLPAMQAFLGDRIPYQRRGAVLALTELSWSLSFVAVVPLLGLAIAWAGWSSPFILLLGVGLVMFVLLLWRVPSDRPAAGTAHGALWGSLGRALTSPRALVALAFSLLVTLANEVVNLVFGVWMNDSFQLEIAALGLAATVIGLAELGGETATAALVDRIGKKRAVRIGVIFTALASLALPWLGSSLIGALVGLFLFYLGFEFTLVSYIPVMTEVFPAARATVMALYLASTSLGRALGALLGPELYQLGFAANGLAALAFNALALLALTRIDVED